MICAVALVLLLDASSSINAQEWRLQVEGHAAALEDEAVLSALRGQGSVAITAIAFAEATHVMVPWRVVAQDNQAGELAAAMRSAPRPLWGGTFIGPAMNDAAAALDSAPCAAEREVIDIVSDGGSDAALAEAARTALEMRGVQVNALGVGTLPGDDPTRWLRAHVVTQGGFALGVSGWGEFAAAMRKKMALEVAAR